MFNGIKRKIRERSERRILRRHFEPRPEFIRESREVFMAAFRERFPEIKLAGHSFLHGPVFKNAVSLAAIFLILNGGIVVFADRANVPADNPLYPYKRIAENVQLSLSSPEKEPVLRKKFAARRLEEIKKVKSQDGQSIRKEEKIKELSSDFHSEVNAALASIRINRAVESSTIDSSEAEIKSSGAATSSGEANDEGAAKTKKEGKNEKSRNRGEAGENESDDRTLCRSFGSLISEHDELVSSSVFFGWSEFQERCGVGVPERK